MSARPQDEQGSSRPPRARRRGALMALAVPVMLVAWTIGNDYAVVVFDVVPGPQATNLPGVALGPPIGEGLYAGSTDVYTLGVGGSITLGFSSPIQDEAGTDLIVCENPFFVVNSAVAFVEALFVEVSTDGFHFARFPTRYTGPPGPFPPTIGIPPTWFQGFAGTLPVSADLALGIDPLDVVAAGGDAFDLADLLDHPAVLAGDVDLSFIEYVRLVDVRAGIDEDGDGNPVWDCGLDTQASAEVDAVVAVNNFSNATSGRPRVELTFVNGFLTIRIEDDSGFADVKAGLSASVNGFPISFYTLLPFFVITDYSSLGVTLVTGPIPPGFVQAILKVTARDHGHLVGGDSVRIR